MTSTKDVSKIQSRKSEILSPSLKDSGRLTPELKSPDVTPPKSSSKRNRGKKRERTAVSEFEQLHSPLIPGKLRKSEIKGEDHASSINSGAHLLNTTKHRFRLSKIAITVMMIFQLLILGAQIYAFIMLERHSDQICSSIRTFCWIIIALSAIGLVFGFWGILSIVMKALSRWYKLTAAVDTLFVVLSASATIAFATMLSESKISQCVSETCDRDLLSF